MLLAFPLLVLAAPTATVAESPRDVREPPFEEFDFRWINGSNPQPPSLLGMGPLTWSLYVDTYFAWDFNHPIDHTIFPTTVAPRHDEVSLNLAHIGIDVTGLDGPTGRLYVQYGSMVETIADRTRRRRAASS
jgi:Putative beta-barrel porin-2, OmpL-like. bbp2